MKPPLTLLDRIWNEHVVVPETEEAPAVLYVDLHLVHEVTSPQAFAELARRGLGVRRPDRTLGTLDHSTPTIPSRSNRTDSNGTGSLAGEEAALQIATLERNAREHRFPLHGLDSPDRGVVHVMGPDLGATWPGATIVCGDSHTSTHGAFGALAFGIGSTEVAHVLATQCVLQRKPPSFRVRLEGRPKAGTSAKDLALFMVRALGADGGAGHAIEFTGDAVRCLSMEGRMTLCNMSIEAGARSAAIAPDMTTIEYLWGRPRAPHGEDWERAIARWASLRSDPEARFDREVALNTSAVEPMITYGTNPAQAIPIGAAIPEPGDDAAAREALAYMGFRAGDSLVGRPIDVVFIGSCTNARIEDLRAAAEIFAGRKIAGETRVLVVPGSGRVKDLAEREGLAKIFIDAGAEWREPGCSMCIAMNGDRARPGQYVMSTGNRNFAGRQGPRVRTLLASPQTAAAAAVTGRVTDPREVIA